MSTTDYLEKLSLKQLRFAKREAERLIAKKQDEEKLKIFVVSFVVDEASFTEDQFLDAKKKLCELIMSNEFEPRDIDYDHPIIRRQLINKNEADSWLSTNT